MKKYTLLKDLPLAKEGTIVSLEDTPIESSVKLIFDVNQTEHPLCTIYEKELDEWLEEIKKEKCIFNLEVRDKYYYIDYGDLGNGEVEDFEIKDDFDFKIYQKDLEIGNVFLTKEEASQELKKRQSIQRIKKYCWENDIELADRDFINDYGNLKCNIYYNIDINKFGYSLSGISLGNDIFLFKTKEDAKKVIENCKDDLEIIFNI